MYVLRDLPVAARLVIACFLISVGCGYLSALVQLHFQNASPGRLLPDPDDAVAIYHGHPQMSQLERVLTADESKPFNGSGSMRAAFTVRSGSGWRKDIDKKAKMNGLEKASNAEARSRILAKAESDVRAERNTERLAIISWIRGGFSEKAYQENAYAVPADLANSPIAEKFVEEAPDGGKRIKIASILETRCVRCHSDTVGGIAAQFPLDSYGNIKAYCDVETTGGGMSLKKLAQSTHVHLLGFSMLYGLTGLIFAFTSFPRAVRFVLAPFPLIAQVVDISCWWLARTDPLFAKVIVFSGGAVGAGLLLQIVLGLFNMFGKVGRVVLILLLISAAFGGYMVKERWIDPYLRTEGMSAAAPE
jgi:hypothetical protein